MRQPVSDRSKSSSSPPIGARSGNVGKGETRPATKLAARRAAWLGNAMHHTHLVVPVHDKQPAEQLTHTARGGVLHTLYSRKIVTGPCSGGLSAALPCRVEGSCAPTSHDGSLTTKCGFQGTPCPRGCRACLTWCSGVRAVSELSQRHTHHPLVEDPKSAACMQRHPRRLEAAHCMQGS